MLIDDSQIDNMVNTHILTKNNVAEHIIVHSSATNALTYLSANVNSNDENTIPQVILLDINMPIMNGFDFLDSFIRLANKQISVYMLTSSIDDADMIKSLKYPCVKGYFSKPLTTDTIAQIYSIQEMHTVYEK